MILLAGLSFLIAGEKWKSAGNHCSYMWSSNIVKHIMRDPQWICILNLWYEIGHAAGGSPMGIVCVPNRCGFAWVPRWEVWKFTDPTNSGPQKNTLRKVTLWQTNSSRTGKSPSLSSVNQLFQCAMFNSYFDITRGYTFIQDDPKMGKVTRNIIFQGTGGRMMKAPRLCP